MNLITRPERRNDLEGELLPPDDSRAIVPWEQQAIRIRLPQAKSDEPGLLQHEVRRPARAPSLESDFFVPGVQAFFTALCAAICAALLAWAFQWPGKVVLVAFGVVLAGAWIARLRVADSLLWEIESIIGRDLNGDGQTGQPHGPILVNPAEARSNVQQERADDDAEHERQELIAFVHRCFTVGCSETAHGVKRGSGSERENYVKRRDLLLALGIATWRNDNRPSAGWKLAVSHQRAVEILARHVL